MRYILFFLILLNINIPAQAVFAKREIRSKLLCKPVRFSLSSTTWFIGLFPAKILEQGLNGLMLSYEGISKGVIKAALYLLIWDNTLMQAGPIIFTAHHAIDYGCEAIWSGYWDGVESIARSMVRKMCVDLSYKRLVSCSSYMKLDYPASIKSNTLLYASTRFVTGLVLKELIAKGADRLFACILQNEENPEETDLEYAW